MIGRISEETLAWAGERIRAHTQGRTLDIGCGEGRFLPSGGVGLDLDMERLRVARLRSRRVVRGDAHALPFRDGAFDTTYAHRMLNDAGRIDAVLEEIRRVLRPDGRLVVFTGARHHADAPDRLDRGNGADRLRRHFERVAAELPSSDERAALFVAEGPR